MLAPHDGPTAPTHAPCRPAPDRMALTSRILGIDLGSRRIGLAVADAGIGIARPLATVNRGATLDDDVAALERVCREQA